MEKERTKLINSGQLDMLTEKISALFVKKEAGKGLSANDFDDASKAHLENLVNIGAVPNIIEEVKVNDVAVIPNINKSVNIAIPTKISDIENDADLVDLDELNTTLNTRLATKADKATTLSGYGIIDALTESEVKSLVEASRKPKGSVSSLAELIEKVENGDIHPKPGDFYNILNAGGEDMNGIPILKGSDVVFVDDPEEGWNKLGGLTDLTDYTSKTYVQGVASTKVDKIEGKQLSEEDFTTELKNKVNGIFSNATRVEASSTNGSIKINGVDTVVYALPDTVLQVSDIADDASIMEMLNTVFA